MTSIRTSLAGPAVVAALLAALLAALTACAPADEGDAPPGEPAPPATSAPAEPPAAPQGGETERAAVEAAFRGYYEALLARDFPRACALTAPETREKLLENLAAQGGQAATCEEALTQIYASPANAELADNVAKTLQIQEVTVDGDTATITWSAEVQGQRPVVTNQLRLIDGQWRLLDTT